MSYNSLEEIVRECQEKDLPFDEVILLDDMNERNVSREESIETMRGMWEAMKGAERNYDGSLQSRSGLVGGAGKTMRAYVEIVGILNGYHGLITGEYKEMCEDDFRGILTLGGTILGTKRTPFKLMRVVEEDKIDKVAAMKKTYKDAKLDCLL